MNEPPLLDPGFVYWFGLLVMSRYREQKFWGRIGLPVLFWLVFINIAKLVFLIIKTKSLTQQIALLEGYVSRTVSGQRALMLIRQFTKLFGIESLPVLPQLTLSDYRLSTNHPYVRKYSPWPVECQMYYERISVLQLPRLEDPAGYPAQ